MNVFRCVHKSSVVGSVLVHCEVFISFHFHFKCASYIEFVQMFRLFVMYDSILSFALFLC